MDNEEKAKEEEKRCETCRHLNEEKTPCECLKGKGQVSYRRLACELYLKRARADG